MKKAKITLLCLIVFTSVIAINFTAYSQGRVPKSPHATVTQRIGLDADMTFDYNRPGVKGRKVWGELVPYGMNPGNDYSKNKPYPWRVGADKNSTFESTKDLLVEGKKLPAGKYGLHMIPSEKSFIVIFNKRNDDWGSYSYDEAEDALRVEITPVKADHMEWLFLGFEDLTDNSATAVMHWEKLKIPISVKLAD